MNPPHGFFRRTARRSFADRREAGRALAEELGPYRNRSDVLVLGLARGGVPVAWEVAAALHAPLDVFLVRKLGAPPRPELAMGAVASGGGIVMNDDVVSALRITDQQVRRVIESETAELERRERAYRGDRPAADVRDKVVILVDDGIATGASMLAAVRAVRSVGPKSVGPKSVGPKSVVVAVPVGPQSTCRQLAREADEVVCATMPSGFEAVGQVYGDFRQIADGEVRELLDAPPG